MQDHVTRALEDVQAAGLQYAWQYMRSRANSEPLFLPPDLSRFTCKQKEKRRGWDSNPRDGLTPPTRFPIALLRPTRTPLRKRRTGVYQKANLVLLAATRGAIWMRS